MTRTNAARERVAESRAEKKRQLDALGLDALRCGSALDEREAMFMKCDPDARAFATWLLRTYGAAFLNTGSGVVDAAGGIGELSCCLALLGVRSTVVDPKPTVGCLCAARRRALVKAIAFGVVGGGGAGRSAVLCRTSSSIADSSTRFDGGASSADTSGKNASAGVGAGAEKTAAGPLGAATPPPPRPPAPRPSASFPGPWPDPVPFRAAQAWFGGAPGGELAEANKALAARYGKYAHGRRAIPGQGPAPAAFPERYVNPPNHACAGAGGADTTDSDASDAASDAAAADAGNGAPRHGFEGVFEVGFGHELLASCSMVLGLHPDEATDFVSRLASAHGKPFAVVPCCVFASLHPYRTLPGSILPGTSAAGDSDGTTTATTTATVATATAALHDGSDAVAPPDGAAQAPPPAKRLQTSSIVSGSGSAARGDWSGAPKQTGKKSRSGLGGGGGDGDGDGDGGGGGGSPEGVFQHDVSVWACDPATLSAAHLDAFLNAREGPLEARGLACRVQAEPFDAFTCPRTGRHRRGYRVDLWAVEPPAAAAAAAAPAPAPAAPAAPAAASAAGASPAADEAAGAAEAAANSVCADDAARPVQKGGAVSGRRSGAFPSGRGPLTRSEGNVAMAEAGRALAAAGFGWAQPTAQPTAGAAGAAREATEDDEGDAARGGEEGGEEGGGATSRAASGEGALTKAALRKQAAARMAGSRVVATREELIEWLRLGRDEEGASDEDADDEGAREALKSGGGGGGSGGGGIGDKGPGKRLRRPRFVATLDCPGANTVVYTLPW